jgi:hypothetical protein
MAEAIEHLWSGLVVGHVKPGCRNQQRGSVAQRVPDGDMVIIEAGWSWHSTPSPSASTPVSASSARAARTPIHAPHGS